MAPGAGSAAGDVAIANYRAGIVPTGTLDGDNRDFTLPENVLVATFALYHNSRRLLRAEVDSPSSGDYILQESGGAGAGFDTIHFLRFKPIASSQLQADYVVAA